MKNEPIRHHYIPQFILRQFSEDGTTVHFVEKTSETGSRMNIRDVFMERNLYRDEKNYPANPVETENEFAAFESEVSCIIKSIVSCDKEITLNVADVEKLKLFLAIMGFRSKNTEKFFRETISPDGRLLYSNYQVDGDYTDLWKRNLGRLARCRSLQEVMADPEIDEPVKAFILRDTEGYFGTFFVVAERRGQKDFLISDCFPTEITGETESGLKLIMYSIFPISPSRVLLQVYDGVVNAPEKLLYFDRRILKRKIALNSGKITIPVRTVYQNTVTQVNKMIVKNAEIGVAYRSGEIVDFL